MSVHGTADNALGVLPDNKSSITTEPSHRFTGAHQSLFLRLFWLGHRSPPEHVKTAYKRFLNDHRKGLPQYTHDQRFMTTHAVVCFVQIPQ